MILAPFCFPCTSHQGLRKAQANLRTLIIQFSFAAFDSDYRRTGPFRDKIRNRIKSWAYRLDSPVVSYKSFVNPTNSADRFGSRQVRKRATGHTVGGNIFSRLMSRGSEGLRTGRNCCEHKKAEDSGRTGHVRTH